MAKPVVTWLRCRAPLVFLWVGVLVVGLAAMTPTTEAATGINQQVNFQGRLYNAAGAVVNDGNYNLEFKIYQDGTGCVSSGSSPCGGTLKWTEDWINNNTQGVQVKNGYFSVQLGSICPLGGSTCQGNVNTGVDWNQDTLWLSINVGNTNPTCTPFSGCAPDTEMLPFKRFAANAYALNSSKLGGIAATGFVQLGPGSVQADGSTNSSIFINKTASGNLLQLQASGTDAFSLTNAGDLVFGQNANHTISVTQTATNAAGKSLTVTAGAGGSGASANAGGDISLQGGAGGGTNGNGGNAALDAGAKNGSGNNGNVNIGTVNALQVTIGNTTGSEATNLTAGSGNINLQANTVVAANKNLTFTAGSGVYTQNYNAATGDAFSILATSATLSTARLAVIDHTASYSTNVTDSGNGLRVNRALTSTANTLTLNGALATLSSNCTVAGGACTDSAKLLSLTQSYASASGDLLTLSNSGTGKDISGTGNTWNVAKTGAAVFSASLNSSSSSFDLLSTPTTINFGVGASTSINIGNSSGAVNLQGATTTIATLGTANTATYLCRATGNVVATCNTTGAGVAFVQGGNSFTAAGDLGTNDANALNLRTNNATRLTISTTGNLQFAQSSTINTASAASGTTLTIQAGAATTGTNTGGNLTLQGGAGASTGAPGSVIVKANTNNSTSAFQVQRAAATPVLTVDTTNSQTILRGINSDATQGAQMMTGSESFPATTGWTAISGTGSSATATHTSGGGATALSPTPALTITAGSFYLLSFAVNGMSAGTITPSVGGSTGVAISQSGSYTMLLNPFTTANLAFTPSNTFDGTITTVSLTLITISNSTLNVQDSTGATALEVRASNSFNQNTFIGLSSGQSNVGGLANTALGSYSLENNAGGGNNTAIGTFALAGNEASNNTAIGSSALSGNSSGTDNAALGYNSLDLNVNGSYNAALGSGTLGANTYGGNNVALGYKALNSNTTGSNNVGLGYQAGYTDGTFATPANLQNATAIGYLSQVQASNSLILGGQDTNAVKVGIGITVPTNTLSVSPIEYNTGTVSQAGFAAVVGVGTTFTAAMMGADLVYADGVSVRIIGFTDATHIDVTPQVTHSSSAYRIHYPGLQVTNTGNVGVGVLNPSNLFEVEYYNTSGGIPSLSVDNNAVVTVGTGVTGGVLLQNNTTVASNKNLTLSSGTGTYTQTYNGNSDAFSILATASLSTARLAVIDHTNTYTTSVTNSGNNLRVNRSYTTNTGGALTLTGALATLSSNCTVTAGTCTDSANLLSLTQSYASASGALLNFANSGTGADIQGTSNTWNVTKAGVASFSKVGVGTTNPQAALHVVQNTAGSLPTGIGGNTSAIFQNNDSTSRVNDVILVAGSAATSSINFADSGAAYNAQGRILYDLSTDFLALYTAGSERLRIDSSGNAQFNQASTINVVSAATGTALTIKGGAATSGTNVGGNLILQGGAGASTGAPGSVIVKANTNDSTTAFQVQQAGSTDVLTVDTTNSQTLLRGINSTASIGSELLNQAPPTNNFNNATFWTNTNWTVGTTTAQHNTGNTSALSTTASDLSVTAGATYQITFTVTGNPTAGETIAPSIGSTSIPGISGNIASETVIITAFDTSGLSFTPSTNWNGTISAVSVKLVTLSQSVLTVKNSDNSVALEVRSGGSGSSNTFIGQTTGGANVGGNSNTGVGASSLKSNTSGFSNSGFGVASLAFNTTGANNSAFGRGALNDNVTGSSNVAVGAFSLSGNNNGSNNVSVGYTALQSNISSNNTGIGYSSLNLNTSGLNNTAVGMSSLQSNTTGSNNTALGYQAGYQDPTVATFVSGTTLQNTTTLGYGSQVQASNSLILGGQGANQAKVGIGTTIPTNLLSVSPDQYDTGTISQTASATVVGSGTTFTSAMVGSQLIYADGTSDTIITFTDVTHVIVNTSRTHSSSAYRIHLPALQVTSVGLVGIGTAAPSANLHVTGADPIIRISPTSGSPRLQFSDTTPTNVKVQLAQGLTGNYKDFDIATSGGATIVGIDTTTLRVGIGVDSASALLHVSGTGGGNDLFRVTDTTATARDVLRVQDGGAVTLRNQTDSASAFEIQNTNSEDALRAGTSTVNLLTNTGFETNTAGWTAKGSSTLTSDSTQSLYGLSSLKSANTATTLTGAQYSFTPGSNATYTFSFYAKLGSGSMATFAIGHNAGSDIVDCSSMSVTTTWQRYSCSMFLTTATSFIFLEQSDATARDIYVDGAQLETGSVATGYAPGKISLDGVINGPTTFQNKTDSTSAFTIQNAAATTTMFSVDTANGRVGIGTAPGAATRTLDVVGNHGGNVVVDNQVATVNTTVPEATAAIGYHLTNTTGTTASVTPTLTFNITGLPNIDGTYAFIASEAIKGASLPASTSTVTIQINGTQVSTVTTGSSTGAVTVKENYIIMRTNGAWRIMGYGPANSDTADLAEWIHYTGTQPELGDVLTIGDQAVSAKDSAAAYDNKVIGVVSTSPHTVMGANDGHSVVLALTGRVPVKVSLENGPIVAGDYLTSSSTPGVAMKATHAGRMLGTALEDYDPSSGGTVMALVSATYADPNPDILQGNKTITGNLNINGSAQIGADLLVAGNLTTKDLVVTESATINNLTVTNLVTAELTVNGHIVTGGDQPTVSIQPGAGDGAGATITGNDTSGIVTITTGTVANNNPPLAAGALAKITFAKPYGSKPRVVLTPANPDAANLRYYFDSANTDYTVMTTSAPEPDKTYAYSYVIVQ